MKYIGKGLATLGTAGMVVVALIFSPANVNNCLVGAVSINFIVWAIPAFMENM